MSTLQNANLCLRCGGYYFVKACPKCPSIFPKNGIPSGEAVAGIREGKVPAAQTEREAASGNRAGGGEMAKRTMSAPKLNKTEQRWQDAHPNHKPFPLKLRWGKCMIYTPDFGIIEKPLTVVPITLIEVKGAHIWSRDLVRYRGCRAEWEWIFTFEMWQWKNQTWTRLE